MVAGRTLKRAAIVLLMVAGPTLWYACSDNAPDSPAGPPTGRLAELRNAIAVQRRHTQALLETPGVIGTAVTSLPNGRASLLILTERSGISGIPFELEGVPVTEQVTGRIMALSDPTQRRRPAPMGYSVGHFAITAGTIGARVRDAQGRVYILSNNHVLANTNNASIGDRELQPGPFDGGTTADQIATLSDFQTILFNGSSNTIDAAIALSSVDVLDNAVPSDDGYGMPSSTIYGDANGDGMIDDRNALLGLNVQKYGRTTKLTHGQITGVNATVTVCYAADGFVCTKSARFVDQLIISPAGFSNGGDSGSLIVTDDGNVNPVALLFAGSATVTIGNRIDLVLNRFGVTIDGSSPPPPGPFTDVGVLSVSGPSAAVQNTASNIAVLVKNVGNQDVGTFDVTLEDTTAHVTVGTQAIAGLSAGAATTLNFAWTPLTVGTHDLIARHTLADDRAPNNQRLASIPVEAPVTDVAVTGISVTAPAIEGHVVGVAVTVENLGNRNVAGFDVTLRDATADVTLGTQAVAALNAGASATRTFTWNLTGAAIGQHLLVATHSMSDDSAANNQLNVYVLVNPKPTDLAVTGITAPARVNQGDTAHVGVTIKNVGELDVTSSFNIELTDGQADNAVVATQTVTGGIPIGGTTTVDVPWNTAGASIGGHTIFATQKLPDAQWNNNSMAISVIVQQPPVLDLGITGVTAPASVIQGNTAAITVSVQNVGGQNVSGNFDLVLRDATAGVTIGTQTIPGLGPSGSTSRTFNWNTAGVAIGGHTLVATHTVTDANAANNQASATVTVIQPSLDISVTSMTAPGSVMKGSSATIGVTVQNVGGQNVTSSFNVVVTDATAGVTIGTQAVAGLAPGASASRSFSWSTSTAAVGNHTITATHTLTDDNPSNNQRSATVAVLQSPADIALTSITAPGSATVGDTVPVVVTVQNVGGLDATSTFDIVLTDGSAGNAVLGTQSVAGLAAGASATRSFNWNTAGATIGGHIVTATQKLPDANASNNAMARAITVNGPSVHVGNIDGFLSAVTIDTWSANVRVTAHDSRHNPVNGVTVRGSWNSGPEVQCITSDAEVPGTCVLTLAGIPAATRTAYFGMSGMSATGYTYKPASNHDPDGSSNGFGIFVRR